MPWVKVWLFIEVVVIIKSSDEECIIEVDHAFAEQCEPLSIHTFSPSSWLFAVLFYESGAERC
jgi:hypothetical protein